MFVYVWYKRIRTTKKQYSLQECWILLGAIKLKENDTLFFNNFSHY